MTTVLHDVLSVVTDGRKLIDTIAAEQCMPSETNIDFVICTRLFEDWKALCTQRTASQHGHGWTTCHSYVCMVSCNRVRSSTPPQHK